MKIVKQVIVAISLSLLVEWSLSVNAFAAEEINTSTETIAEEKGFWRSIFSFGNSSKPTETTEEKIIDSAVEDSIEDTEEKKEEISDQISINKKASFKYRIKLSNLILFESKLEVIGSLNKDVEFVMPISEEDQELYVEEYFDREDPIMMSHIDIKQSVDEYYAAFFSGFTTIARLKLIHSDIYFSEIKGFAAYIGSNLVIMKKFYEPTIGSYVYDILFLNGNTTAKDIYWYRNISEAVLMENILKELKITDINSYSNLITHSNINPSRILRKKIEANYTKSAEAPSGNLSPELQNKIATMDSSQGENSTETNVDLLEITDQDMFEIQKEFLAFRVNAVVGLWENIETGEIIEIRTLGSAKKSKNTAPTYVGYSVELPMTLGNQIVEPAEQIVESETDPTSEPEKEEAFVNYLHRSLRKDNKKINKYLTWIKEDLKFQFSTNEFSGIYLDEEKMVNTAKFYFHPAKGLISIILPNKQYVYLRPIVPDLLLEIEESFYNDVKLSVGNVDQNNIKRYSSELSSTKGVTSYIAYAASSTVAIFVLLLLVL